jgi:2-polyprenyl-6-methoxyphenol hydroxylase-like FAD-dependent oxidoreductase
VAVQKPYRHAVVVGGSVAGLLAANSLAKHFSRVTVVERDVPPAKAGIQRRGVPQGKHLHILLGHGREVMENMLPGLTAGLIADGAVTTDLLGGIRYIFEGRRIKQKEMGMPSVLAGRTLVETHIRDRVLALDNVSFLGGHEVTRLVLDASEDRIKGVHTSPTGDPGNEASLEADLVIDATGRGARGTAWLRDAGLKTPDEDQTTINIAYTTRHFRRRTGDLGDDQAVIITPTVENRRGGVMNAQEGGTWIVTLFGYLGEEAPLDLAGFREFAGTLAVKDIYEVLTEAEPVDDAAMIRFPASRRRHYETLDGLPKGYLTIGDALCSFNPIYGQGMTVAALEADILGTCLDERQGESLSAGSGLTRDFYARLTPVLDGAWITSVGGDLKYPEVAGVRTPEWEQINAFTDQLYLAATRDAALSRTLVRLINLLDGPDVLQDPAFLERVRAAGAGSDS